VDGDAGDPLLKQRPTAAEEGLTSGMDQGLTARRPNTGRTRHARAQGCSVPASRTARRLHGHDLPCAGNLTVGIPQPHGHDDLAALMHLEPSIAMVAPQCMKGPERVPGLLEGQRPF